MTISPAGLPTGVCVYTERKYTMRKQIELSKYLSFLLRHKPEELHLEMDRHGWVSAEALIEGINAKGGYQLNNEKLKEIVDTDDKGRYRFSEDGKRIKACQGHSIPWIEPEMEYSEPPLYLYHGTTTAALEKILNSGAIMKQKRHAVHMQADPEKAWQSAERWHLTPVLLKIDAKEMHRQGFVFGKTENEVWCTEIVPTEFIAEKIYRT